MAVTRCAVVFVVEGVVDDGAVCDETDDIADDDDDALDSSAATRDVVAAVKPRNALNAR